MFLNNSIEIFSKQLTEAARLNSVNKIEDTFYTVAPLNEKKRYEFIEELKWSADYNSVKYKMGGDFEVTSIYHVKVIFYDYNVIMIFTEYPFAG